MVDGEEQRARDELVRKQKDEPQEGYPFYWLDPGLQGYVYGYDVIEEVRKVYFCSSSVLTYGIAEEGRSQLQGCIEARRRDSL